MKLTIEINDINDLQAYYILRDIKVASKRRQFRYKAIKDDSNEIKLVDRDENNKRKQILIEKARRMTRVELIKMAEDNNIEATGLLSRGAILAKIEAKLVPNISDNLI